jgi:hypothetical protein
MRIQESHFTKNAPLHANGFVVTRWLLQEWEKLIENGSSLFTLQLENKKVGAYLLLAPYRELETFLEEAKQTLDIDFEKYPKEDWRYIYQVCVTKAQARTGLGTLLGKEALRRTGAKHLFADFLISPWRNQASESILKKNGFQPCCELRLESYRDLTPSIWQIVKLI